MKALVFIGGHERSYRKIEERLNNVVESLGLDGIEYVIANVPAAIRKVISEGDVGAVITYGCKPETEAIATEAGVTVIRYKIEDDKFTKVKTSNIENGGGYRIWSTEHIPFTEKVLR